MYPVLWDITLCRDTSFSLLVSYLEELKQHVVEVGRHVDNVEGLVRVFGCEAIGNVGHLVQKNNTFP